MDFHGSNEQPKTNHNGDRMPKIMGDLMGLNPLAPFKKPRNHVFFWDETTYMIVLPSFGWFIIGFTRCKIIIYIYVCVCVQGTMV